MTVEKMRQASMALMELIPTEPSEVEKLGTSVGTSAVGTGNSDDERAAVTAS